MATTITISDAETPEDKVEVGVYHDNLIVTLKATVVGNCSKSSDIHLDKNGVDALISALQIFRLQLKED